MKSTPATAGIDAFRFARSMAAMRQSELREILVSASQPGVISFAVGLPAAELFPRFATQPLDRPE